MVEIKGIYAASVSVLNDDMSLNIKKTANHCEKIIKDGSHIWKHRSSTTNFSS